MPEPNQTWWRAVDGLLTSGYSDKLYEQAVDNSARVENVDATP